MAGRAGLYGRGGAAPARLHVRYVYIFAASMRHAQEVADALHVRVGCWRQATPNNLRASAFAGDVLVVEAEAAIDPTLARERADIKGVADTLNLQVVKLDLSRLR